MSFIFYSFATEFGSKIKSTERYIASTLVAKVHIFDIKVSHIMSCLVINRRRIYKRFSYGQRPNCTVQYSIVYRLG